MDYISLIKRRCGYRTTSQIFERVFHQEQALYNWLEQNPHANKDEIRRKSHEIAGTLDEYENTMGKRFYVIQAYRETVERMSWNNPCTFVDEMILGSDLMMSALEIADDMPLYSARKDDYLYSLDVGARIHTFVAVLKEHDIEWKKDEMLTADVSNMSAEDVIALFVCMTWRNRLMPGAIRPYLKEGTIIKWLNRLEELEQ